MLVLQEVANEGDEAFVEVATKWCIAFGVGSASSMLGIFTDYGNRKLPPMFAPVLWLLRVPFLPPHFAT